MTLHKICILGGTGFVGRHLAERLSQKGHAVRILTRNRERHRENLLVLPGVELIEANVHDPVALKNSLQDEMSSSISWESSMNAIKAISTGTTSNSRAW